jgi:hypothetical protein
VGVLSNITGGGVWFVSENTTGRGSVSAGFAGETSAIGTIESFPYFIDLFILGLHGPSKARWRAKKAAKNVGLNWRPSVSEPGAGLSFQKHWTIGSWKTLLGNA